jgi:PhnB protein
VSSDQHAVPAGFPTVSPYLIVDDAAAAIEYYGAVFGAVETFRLTGQGSRIVHAEIRIGDSIVMLGEKSPDYDFMTSANDLKDSPINLHLYLPDADAAFERALQHGADVVMPLEDHSDGDRRGGIRDPFGLIWWIARATDPDARNRLMAEQPNA